LDVFGPFFQVHVVNNGNNKDDDKPGQIGTDEEYFFIAQERRHTGSQDVEEGDKEHNVERVFEKNRCIGFAEGYPQYPGKEVSGRCDRIKVDGQDSEAAAKGIENIGPGFVKLKRFDTDEGIETEMQHQQAAQYQEEGGEITCHSVAGKNFLTFINRIDGNNAFYIDAAFQREKEGVTENNQRRWLQKHTKSERAVLFVIHIAVDFEVFVFQEIFFLLQKILIHSRSEIDEIEG
jgi:hypothetical protein